MAKIKKMIGEKAISGFRGTLDFYFYMGLACVRSWPRSPGHHRTPQVEAGWPAWSYTTKTWSRLDPEIRDAYIWTAQESNLSGYELYIKSFINSYFEEGQWA